MMSEISPKLAWLKEAAEEIKAAFDQGLYLKDPTYYSSLGNTYGHLAFEIFQATHPKLDRIYTFYRSLATHATPDDEPFWCDEQAVLALYETLQKEGCYGCA